MSKKMSKLSFCFMYLSYFLTSSTSLIFVNIYLFWISYQQHILKTLAIFRQGTNLPVLLATRSAVLDRGRQIGVLFWSADFPPRRVHLFPPHLLSKNEAAMCRPLREVGGGVNDLHCCASFKTKKQLITAASPSFHLRTLRWTTGQPLRSRRC